MIFLRLIVNYFFQTYHSSLFILTRFALTIQGPGQKITHMNWPGLRAKYYYPEMP